MSDTLNLPVVDFSVLSSKEEDRGSYLAECRKAAEAFRDYGAVAVRDPRVVFEDNETFLSMMERYFENSDGVRGDWWLKWIMRYHGCRAIFNERLFRCKARSSLSSRGDSRSRRKGSGIYHSWLIPFFWNMFYFCVFDINKQLEPLCSLRELWARRPAAISMPPGVRPEVEILLADWSKTPEHSFSWSECRSSNSSWDSRVDWRDEYVGK